MGSCLSNPRPRRGCSPTPRRSPNAISMISLPWVRTWSRAPSSPRTAAGCSRCRSAGATCTGGHPIHGPCCPSTVSSCRGRCAGPAATSRSGWTRPSPTWWPVAPIPARPQGWINADVAAAYIRLHELGWAHSVEAWQRRRTRGRTVRRGHRRPVRGRVDVPSGAGRLEGRAGRAGRAAVRRPADGCSTSSGAPTTCAAWGSSVCRARTTWLGLPDVLALPLPAFLEGSGGCLTT